MCARSSSSLTLTLARAGLQEASDIVLYLTPLRVSLEEMEQADLTAVCRQDRGQVQGLVSHIGAWGGGHMAGIRRVGLRSACPCALGSPPGAVG